MQSVTGASLIIPHCLPEKDYLRTMVRLHADHLPMVLYKSDYAYRPIHPRLRWDRAKLEQEKVTAKTEFATEVSNEQCQTSDVELVTPVVRHGGDLPV